MKFLIFHLIIFTRVAFSGHVNAQDTIHWRPEYKLKWEDFQASPDTTAIALAVCASEITYTYKIVDGKLTYTIDCFFDKKKSWIKYNLIAITDHEQGHFDISKLFALKLAEKFKSYNVTNAHLVYQDLRNIYNSIIQERTVMHSKYDQETKSTTSDELQKQFISNIRRQITILQRQMGLKQ
jgi:hypothetical protein